MKLIQLEIPECGKCVIKKDGDANDPVEIVTDHVREMLSDGDAGDVLIVSIVEMTEEEYAALPEWEGW